MSKLGLLAYSTDTGLGNQTLEVYKNLKPEKVLVADLSKFNRMPTHHERFVGARVADGIPTNSDMEWLVDGVEAVLVCETPLNYYLFSYARQKGVKTYQQYNREFLDFWKHPEWPQPNFLAYPAEWEVERVRALGLSSKLIPLPVPVNRDDLKFRRIERLETVIHIIGRPAYMDRNGTLAFLELALRYPRYEYIVYVQPPNDDRAIEYFEPVRLKLDEVRDKLNIKVVNGVDNYSQLYSKGDLLILPRRYGGLCLPMQEALSVGMPVIMTNISPNYNILPKEWLCEAELAGEFFFHAPVTVYNPSIDSLSNTFERFTSSEYISEANLRANRIADAFSWDNLKPLYESL